MTYDPDGVAAFYDAYGEREWTRFEDGRTSAVSFHVHRHYLERFITPGDVVLDAGAGPGRFTIELARLGARVVVADLSPTQLELNRAKVAEAGVEASIVERAVADITDLRAFADASFDSVVCFGGPLSYVMDRAGDAVAELLRVTKPGGHVLLSVMSLVGAASLGLAQVIEDARNLGFDATGDVIRSGDLPSAFSGGHAPMHMFRWSELRELLERQPCRIVAASAASIGVPQDHALFASLTPEQQAALIRWEIDLGAEPGAISSGAHMIAVVQKDVAEGRRSPVVGADHVQLAIPPGGEPAARRFYGDVLGLREVEKPSALAGRGGCWFVGPGLDVHLGVEQPFQPARKAHVALLVADIDAVRRLLMAAGVTTTEDDATAGVRRFYAQDPFGNRLEFVDERDRGFTSRTSGGS